jgi:long-chain fatty acid transport protein
MRLPPLAFIAVASWLSAGTNLLALGFRIADQDAEATARSNAFAATADNPSAVYYNPAGITQLEGTQSLLGAYGITFNSRADLRAGGKPFDNKYDAQAAPQSYATMHLEGTPFTIGYGCYVPFGFAIKYADTVPFRTLAKEGSIQCTTINPVIALQVSSTLSVAIGPTIDYGTAYLVRGIVAPGDEFRFRGDGFGAGFNAGIMWKPHPMHSFGLTYFSAIDLDFGGYTNTYFKDVKIPVQVAPGVFKRVTVVKGVDQRETADAPFNLPQRLTFGYSFRPTPDWNFEADIDWTDWDSLNTQVIERKSGPLAIPFNWRSSFMYEFGVTRRIGDWHVSAGYMFSQSSVPNESFSPLIPDSDRHVIGVGVGHKAGKVSWDVTYQYSVGGKRTINQGTIADGDYRFEGHALSLSLGYQF